MLDTFYDKKRNFPDAEERRFDDIPSIPVILTRASHVPGKNGGLLCRARFIGSTCILSRTSRDFKISRFPLEPGVILTDKENSYTVEALHFNSYPKYAILTLKPIIGFRDSSTYEFALWYYS